MTQTAFERACEKLKTQQINRQRRKECEIIRQQKIRERKRRKNKKGQPLLMWQYYLRLRKKLTMRIMKRTGKCPAQMLLNCSGQTEKAMIQRLLQQAEKLSPENQWRYERLLHNTTRCGLLYTLPDQDSLRRTFEIYGLPEVSKTESQSACCIQNWFKSKAIAKRLEEKKLDIYNVVQHFPDVDGLQIVGKSAKIYPSEYGIITMNEKSSSSSPIVRSTHMPKPRPLKTKSN